jgi:type III secretory pathway component EscS
MKYSTLKKPAIILLVILFFMPLAASQLSTIGQDAETAQYGSLVFLAMGAYNIPILLASLIGIIAGGTFQRRSKIRAANISLGVSILISIAGIIMMLSWGLGA